MESNTISKDAQKYVVGNNYQKIRHPIYITCSPGSSHLSEYNRHMTDINTYVPQSSRAGNNILLYMQLLTIYDLHKPLFASASFCHAQHICSQQTTIFLHTWVVIRSWCSIYLLLESTGQGMVVQTQTMIYCSFTNSHLICCVKGNSSLLANEMNISNGNVWRLLAKCKYHYSVNSVS